MTNKEQPFKGREKEYKHEWYLKNLERCKKLQKERYERNKTQWLLLSKLYQAEHPEATRRNKRKNKDKIRFDGNRQSILERDRFVCRLCGENSQLIIHHIDGTTNRKEEKNANNDPTNLITLCRSCHLKVHKYKMKI